MNKTKEPLRIGAKIRRLRRGLGMSQAKLAESLGISTAYLNLIENNHRRISLNLLVEMSKILNIELPILLGQEDHRLMGTCLEVFADDEFEEYDITNVDVKQFVHEMPQIARAFTRIFEKYHETIKENNDLRSILIDNVNPKARIPNEIIIDFMQEQRNYFQDLEDAAVRIRYDIGHEYMKNVHLIEYLLKFHQVQVFEETPKANSPMVRHFDPQKKTLTLADNLVTYTKHFQLAYIIAWLGGRSVIEMLIKQFRLDEESLYPLARTVFTNYLAAAILMPYDAFLQSALRTRYDIELMQNEYRVSFEQICHRLSTLNHPDESRRGIPLHFLKTDRAGNISKKFSLSGMPIPRLGSACPRWNIYEAFHRPEEIVARVQEFSDGTQYLNVAQAVRKGQRGYQHHHLVMGIMIGCSIHHAKQMIYGDYVENERNPTRSIGVSCRTCGWMDCPDRIIPYINQKSTLNPLSRGISPYMTGNY